MNYNHNNTCPLCRLENVTARLEAVLAALGVPSLAEIFPASDLGNIFHHGLNMDVVEQKECDELTQLEAGIHQARQQRLDAYVQHEQGRQRCNCKD